MPAPLSRPLVLSAPRPCRPLLRALPRTLAWALPLLVFVAAVDARAQTRLDTTALRRARADAAARALQAWVDGFVRGRIKAAEPAFVASSSSSKSSHPYIDIAASGRVLSRPKKMRQKTTHFTLLQRMVSVAERYPYRKIADALLAVSAAGYSRDLYSGQTIMVRDLGHFALMRTSDPTIWSYILEVAAGAAQVHAPMARAVAVGAGDEAAAEREKELAATARVMRRVAAVRLLGMKKNPVFRVTLEKCLASEDARIRLAAAEALGNLKDLRYLYPLTKKIAEEGHPLVVLAMLSAVERTLKMYHGKVPIARGMNTVRLLLPMLGTRGWRNDMTVVQLIRKYPVKAAVPALIHLMRGAQAEIDPLLKAVNEKASPVLADEAFRTLRQITGAMIPPDPDKWQKFWDAEKGRLHLVAPYRKRRKFQGGTRGTFFGVPVIGREVVFVIDTSGSMREPIATGTVTPDSKGAKMSRLDAAKRQMVNAAQGIPKATRYHLVTFSSSLRVWNQKPIRSGPNADRTLTQALGRMSANGGTNVFAALLHVLNASQARYGQQIKNQVDEVFLLSDGLPSTGPVTNPAEILRLVREINKFQKVRINTVFTGTGKGVDFMRRLAEQNHGAFVRR